MERPTRFIRLIDELKKPHPEVHGLIVGEPHHKRRCFLQELKKEVEARGLENDITFTGHHTDLREVMAISAIVLSLSREPEAFGRTTVEALSLGIPVIGYKHGGVGEQLAAILPQGAVPLGDIKAAAIIVHDWLAEPPVVPPSHPFTLEQMLASTLNVYLELTKK
jgi:glycosyltransferase involved in cell wall biosynthesis